MNIRKGILIIIYLALLIIGFWEANLLSIGFLAVMTLGIIFQIFSMKKAGKALELKVQCPEEIEGGGLLTF